MNLGHKSLFKTILFLFIAVQASYPLDAPYLISATAQGDSTVELVWRNNDAATQGFIIQRKDSNAAVFNTIDSCKSATQLSYIDAINIKPLTLYTYQIRAYTSTEVSDTSNSLQVTTDSLNPVLKTPGLLVSWNSDTTNYTRLTIFDPSCCETGYRIYRANGSSSSYEVVAQIISAHTALLDLIVWQDSTIPLNSWVFYKVAVFNGTDSLFSNPCSTYSFHSEQVTQPVTFTKLSEFPISMDSGLSALAGDSLILKESLSPSGKYTAINIKDPIHPKFDGYVDSTALLSYPVKTLIPVFLKYGVANNDSSRKVCVYNEKMLVLQDSVLRRYGIQNNSLVLIDSLSNFKGNSILLLDTTILAVRYNVHVASSTWNYYFYPVQIVDSGFLQFPEYFLGVQGGSAVPLGGTITEPNILGNFKNKIIITADRTVWSHFGIQSKSTDVIVCDILLNRAVSVPNVTSYVTGSNTGCYISSTENLARTNTDLFVSDVRNLHSYEFASSHNGIYRDTVHTNNQLRNILLDTVGKKVYLAFSTNLTILSYQRENIGIRYSANKIVPSRGIAIRPSALYTTIILPANCHNTDVFIYDVSGRIVERMRNITSNAVLFRPKTKSANCYVAVVRNNGREYSEKFTTK